MRAELALLKAKLDKPSDFHRLPLFAISANICKFALYAAASVMRFVWFALCMCSPLNLTAASYTAGSQRDFVANNRPTHPHMHAPTHTCTHARKHARVTVRTLQCSMLVLAYASKQMMRCCHTLARITSTRGR